MNENTAELNSLHQLLLSNNSSDVDIDISEADIDISRICRTCLRETVENDLTNEALCVIDGGGKLVRVYDMFEAVTGMKIEAEDNMPRHICSGCLLSLNTAYMFRMQGQRALEILRSILGRVKEEETTVEYIVDYEEEDGNYEDEEELDDSECKDEIKSSPKSEYRDDVDGVDELDGELLRIEKVVELSESEEDDDLLLKTEASELTCIFCKKAFSLQRDILQHYKDTHPRQKPFKCKDCSAAFAHIQSMRRHIKALHMGSKEKMCPFCSRLFHRSDDLKRHIRTHTNERPYRCKVCRLAFKQHTELKDHSLSHTTMAMYKCTLCSKEWRSRNGWYLHMKAHRTGKPTQRRRTRKDGGESVVDTMIEAGVIEK